jgi:PKD domain
VAAWSAFDGLGFRVRAALRSPGGGWSDVEDVSAAGESIERPALAIDADGHAYAIWPGPAGDEFVVRAADLPAGGEWSEPEPISVPAEGFQSYELETSAAVGVVATWTRDNGTSYGVQAAVRPPGAGWLQPDDLSTAGEDAGLPELGFDAEGNAIAIWGRDAGDDYVLQGSGYDFTGPRLDDLAIPATGTAGQPVSFSVAPFDLFPLGTTSWAFGDGGGASGDAVAHTFSAPGTYSVTVTAFDASGNASTRSGTIAIAAGPPPPPPPRRLELTLRLGQESLRKLLRSGSLSVTANVSEAASLTLSGKAKLKSQGGAPARLVPVLAPKTVRFAAAGDRRVTLALSKRGREKLRPLSQVRIVITGEARDGAGGAATKTAARTLR